MYAEGPVPVRIVLRRSLDQRQADHIRRPRSRRCESCTSGHLTQSSFETRTVQRIALSLTGIMSLLLMNVQFAMTSSVSSKDSVCSQWIGKDEVRLTPPLTPFVFVQLSIKADQCKQIRLSSLQLASYVRRLKPLSGFFRTYHIVRL